MFLAGWERSEGLSPTSGGSVERRGAGDPPSCSSALDLALGRLLGLGGEAALPSSSLAVQIRACSPDALPLHESSTRWVHASPEPLRTRCGADKALRLVPSPVRAEKINGEGPRTPIYGRGRVLSTLSRQLGRKGMGCREIPRKNRCQEASQLLLSVPRACPARQSQPAQPPVVPARGCRLASPGIACLFPASRGRVVPAAARTEGRCQQGMHPRRASATAGSSGFAPGGVPALVCKRLGSGDLHGGRKGSGEPGGFSPWGKGGVVLPALSKL